jgi:hypothetical protein
MMLIHCGMQYCAILSNEEGRRSDIQNNTRICKERLRSRERLCFDGGGSCGLPSWLLGLSLILRSRLWPVLSCYPCTTIFLLSVIRRFDAMHTLLCMVDIDNS